VVRPNFLTQLRILLHTSRGLAVTPGIVATGGDAQHTTHDGDAIDGLIRLYELEDFLGIEWVS
jgi:hypothetical protein